MSSSSADPAEKLNKRIQGLAQELQDLILDFTLEIKPGQFVIIDKKYKPPKQLAINRKLRNKLGAKYYSSSLFVVPKQLCHASTADWFESLAPSSREHIKELRIQRYSVSRRPRATIISWAQEYERNYTRWIRGDSEWLNSIRLLVNLGYYGEHATRVDQLEWYDREQLRDVV